MGINTLFFSQCSYCSIHSFLSLFFFFTRYQHFALTWSERLGHPHQSVTDDVLDAREAARFLRHDRMRASPAFLDASRCSRRQPTPSGVWCEQASPCRAARRAQASSRRVVACPQPLASARGVCDTGAASLSIREETRCEEQESTKFRERSRTAERQGDQKKTFKIPVTHLVQNDNNAKTNSASYINQVIQFRFRYTNL